MMAYHFNNAEDIVILLLGVAKRPLAGELHLQKELFMLSRGNSEIKKLLGFEKRKMGPHSPLIDAILRQGPEEGRWFSFRDGEISLSRSGRAYLRDLEKENKTKKEYSELKDVLFLAREIHDNLSPEELAFLICASYPKYVRKSKEAERMFEDGFRKKMARRLLSKNAVTDERARELRKAKIF